MIEPVLNEEHLGRVLEEALARVRHRLFISTADVKAVFMPARNSSRRGARRASPNILDTFEELSGRNVQVHLLHSGVPSGPFLERLKSGMPETLTMRRCRRVHAKAVIVDGRWMYIGSANLTGAGLGAKSAKRRNFEAGIWTDEADLIDPVADMLESIWSGSACADCGRKELCAEPLEEPDL